MPCIVCNSSLGSNVSYGSMTFSDKSKVVTGDVYSCCRFKLSACSLCDDRCYYLKTILKKNKYTKREVCDKHVDTNPLAKTKAKYNTKPEEYTGFIGKPKDKLYLGVELEVESVRVSVNKSIDEVWDRLGNFIITKHDGSLERGFEIASAPAPLTQHKRRWNPLLSNPPKQLRSFYFNNAEHTYPINCGMHVHVSKAALTTSDVGKTAYFLNKATNRTLITDVAGRYNTTYCAVVPVHINRINDYHSGYEKHVALRTTKPTTIEFRIFKGTLNHLMFLKNIEFTHALVKYARNADAASLETDGLVKYIDDNKSKYDNLYKYLCFKGYLKGKKLPEEMFKNV